MKMIQEVCEMEKMLTRKMNRRIAAEDRYLTRLEKQDAAAEQLIGELVREGETVYYINCVDRRGRFTGKTREGSYYGLVSFLIRNRYV